MTGASSRAERWFVVLTPAAALALVALSLRMGAPSTVRAAVIAGAPTSGAGTGLAWQVVVFEEAHRIREPVSSCGLEVTAHRRDGSARWSGATNRDGVAEMLLRLPGADEVTLEVRAAGALLASGQASPPPAIVRSPPASAWARFARREGRIVLDVAVLGQRVASGFSANIWVRATDAATHLPLAGVTVEAEHDSSLSVTSSDALTDARGWANVVATPIGHSVALTLHAHGALGQAGEWAGALFVSPGGSEIVARDRYAPDEEPTIEVVVPNERPTVYVEIDDARGRAWAGAIDLTLATVGADGLPRATVRVPKLAPNLYWAVTSGDPLGAAHLGPGTITRPFFVAETDGLALSFGTDAQECDPRRNPMEQARALALCLALAAAPPTPRWTALDGFRGKHAHDVAARAHALGLALAAIGIAAVIEGLFLFRAARRTSGRWISVAAGDEGDPARRVAERAWTVGVAVLVGLLGLALLAAFPGGRRLTPRGSVRAARSGRTGSSARTGAAAEIRV